MRCESGRIVFTCQMVLMELSILRMVDTAVNSSIPRPTDPSTPTCMLSMKLMMLVVISAPLGPSGSMKRCSAGSIWPCTPKALDTEKVSASTGTMDSSVV